MQNTSNEPIVTSEGGILSWGEGKGKGELGKGELGRVNSERVSMGVVQPTTRPLETPFRMFGFTIPQLWIRRSTWDFSFDLLQNIINGFLRGLVVDWTATITRTHCLHPHSPYPNCSPYPSPPPNKSTSESFHPLTIHLDTWVGTGVSLLDFSLK